MHKRTVICFGYYFSIVVVGGVGGVVDADFIQRMNFTIFLHLQSYSNNCFITHRHRIYCLLVSTYFFTYKFY